MRVTSLGYRTDLALRALEGGTETDRGGYLVARNPALPDFWWGNFLLLDGPPAAGSASHWLATFAAEFPEAQHVATTLVIVADAEYVAARVYASIGFIPAEEQLGFQRGPVTA